MKFYGIVDKHNEDWYYNFEEEDMVMDLSAQCLLPTKDMTKKYINDYLCDYYEVMEIDLEKLTDYGTMVYSTNEDEIYEYDEEDYE